MPWRMESMQLQKKKFITLWETGRFTKTYLCKEFGISRPTGDAIIQRYQEVGWDALEEQPRRHKSHPLTTAKSIEDAIVNERKAHSNWGCRKIRVLLLRAYGAAEVPSETTVNNILKKHGYSKGSFFTVLKDHTLHILTSLLFNKNGTMIVSLAYKF